MMWERRSYNDGSSVRCTVRFRGTIPQWEDSIALGVEWDDPRRGRNDGCINDVRYFSPRIPFSGSFVRESRLAEKSTTFLEALTEKYLHHIEHENIKLSEKKFVETYGFDKIEKFHKNLPSLQFVSLDSSRVKKLEWDDFSQFSNLLKLDLGNNLLETFREVPTFFSKFPRLKLVRLTGNRLQFDFQNTEPVCPSIETMEMVNMALMDHEVDYILTKFPNLKVVSFAFNLLTKVPPRLPDRMEYLDVSDNRSIDTIGTLPKAMKWACFRGTAISHVTPLDTLPKSLDLRRTRLIWEDEKGHLMVDWNSISEIARQKVEILQFLGAFNLKMRHCIIGRCPALVTLDGTTIDPIARVNAEHYILMAVARKQHPRVTIERWNELIKQYGEPYTLRTDNIQDRLIAFYVDNHPEIVETLRDGSLFRLRTLVAQLTGQDPATMEIKGVTDVPLEFGDRSIELLQVQDAIIDGQRLITYTRPRNYG